MRSPTMSWDRTFNSIVWIHVEWLTKHPEQLSFNSIVWIQKDPNEAAAASSPRISFNSIVWILVLYYCNAASTITTLSIPLYGFLDILLPSMAKDSTIIFQFHCMDSSFRLPVVLLGWGFSFNSIVWIRAFSESSASNRSISSFQFHCMDSFTVCTRTPSQITPFNSIVWIRTMALAPSLHST